MGTLLLNRPSPRALVTVGELVRSDRFVPAPELEQWIQDAYLNEAGPLYTPEHEHLRDATLNCLWTTAENRRQGRPIVGMAEMPERGGGSGKWQRARFEQQLREWFGRIPDFLLTFDAVHATEVDDPTFASLVDHELCHCGQALDEFGMPAFYKDSGKPKFAIRQHDVEEFVSVVRRFGIEAAGERAVNLVLAAAQKPEIATARLAQACGTCLLKAVA